MEDDPDEEDIEDINLDNERERHWRMVFEDNDVGVDNAKALMNVKRWDIYVNENANIVKGGYLVEVVGHDKKEVIWEVVDDHMVEEPTDHEDIVLQEFDFNVLAKRRMGLLEKGPASFHIY